MLYLCVYMRHTFHQTSILTSKREKSATHWMTFWEIKTHRERKRDKMANWKIEKYFSRLKYNCKLWLHLPSVEVRFKTKTLLHLSLYQHQTGVPLPLPLISILVTAASFPQHRPLCFFIYLTPLLKSLISLVRNSFFRFSICQTSFDSLSITLFLSVLPCVTAFHFILFCHPFLEPLCLSWHY